MVGEKSDEASPVTAENDQNSDNAHEESDFEVPVWSGN